MEAKIIRAIQKYGNIDIEVLKVGFVLTLLLTGKGLSNIRTVMDIQTKISTITDKQYPIVEVLKNDYNFFLIVLKPIT